jgi:hypothetical protein
LFRFFGLQGVCGCKIFNLNGLVAKYSFVTV